MTSLLSSHLEDCSTAQYFCFSVRCEVCGEYWYSSSIPFSKAAQAAQHLEKKELYDAIYQREKERAKSAAGQEARERFSQCPVCRRLVCDACFLICDEMDLCRECAASALPAWKNPGNRWRHETAMVTPAPAVPAADRMQRGGLRRAVDFRGRGLRIIQ